MFWKSQTVPLRHVQCFPLLGLLWELRCPVCSHRFRESTVHVCNIACIVSDRIFVLFRLLRLADSRYLYRNNTGIPILLSPDVSIAVSSVSRLTLLGLSFRQYSFYLCRYVHLAVQSQSGNSIDLRRYRHAIVPVVGFPHRSVGWWWHININASILRVDSLLHALAVRAVFSRRFHTNITAVVSFQPRNQLPKAIGISWEAVTGIRRNIRGIGRSNAGNNESFVDINTAANGINNFEGHANFLSTQNYREQRHWLEA